MKLSKVELLIIVDDVLRDLHVRILSIFKLLLLSAMSIHLIKAKSID